ncbi:MAG: hypothetical protein WD077_12945 [Bacteroidia bacterium]
MAQTKDALHIGRLGLNKKNISLRPANQYFQAASISLDQHLQLWKAMAFISNHFSDASSLEDKLEEVLNAWISYDRESCANLHLN